MCILALALGVNSHYPLVLLFNRDEAFERPTQALFRWAQSDITAGLDLMNGGTWLGVNDSGDFAALTNYWEDIATEREFNTIPSAPIGTQPNGDTYMTRGLVPVRLLSSPFHPSLLSQLSLEHYKSFNLISGSIPRLELYYTCIRQRNSIPAHRLTPGLHCVSNKELDSDWEKVQRLKKNLGEKVGRGEVEVEGMMELLRDEVKGGEIEGLTKEDTAVFVRTHEDEHFGRRQPLGTVSSTVLIYGQDGRLTITERNMGCGCGKASDQSIRKTTTEEQGIARGITVEINRSSSNLKVDCVPRFTRQSLFEDFFSRSTSRPSHNSGLLSAYSSDSLPISSPRGRDASLQLDYIYGYRCFLSSQNVFYSLSGETVIYPSAAVVVVLNRKSNVQSFLGGGDLRECEGHSDDIMTLAMSQRRTLVASGEIGRNPLICIWRMETEDCAKQVARLEQGVGTVAVTAMCFSADDRYLLAADQAPKPSIRLYDWRESPQPFLSLCLPSKITHISCSPKSHLFCTVGPSSFSFYSLRNHHDFLPHRPTNSPAHVTMNVSQWFSNGNCITGGSDGKVYLWIEKGLKRSYQVMEEGVEITAMSVIGDVVVVGGRANAVYVLNATFKEIARYTAPDYIISLDKYGERVLCSTRTGVIQEFSGNGRLVLMESHCEREVGSLAVHPQDLILVSTGDDNTIKAWDLRHKKCISTCILEARDMNPRTHRLSFLPLNKQSRALCISEKGHVAVALNDGRVTVRNNVYQLNLILKVLEESKEWVHCMSYTPSGNSLAVSSQDSNVYIYDVQANYQLFHQLASPAPVVSLDWSKDEQLLKTCDVLGDVTCWEVGKEVLVEEPDHEVWFTWTSSGGKLMQAYPRVNSDPEFITCVARSLDSRKLIIGNAWGIIELHSCPYLPNHKTSIYKAHSLEVVKAVWTHRDSILLTAGGSDLSIIQWKVVS